MTALSRNARVAGLLYIVASVVGVLRLLYIPTVLIVHGNAAATAHNIAAHESLFTLGIVGQLLASVLWIFVTLALHRLLKDVNRSLAAVMVILGSLMMVPIAVVNTMNDAAALLLVRGADFLSAIGSPLRDALALLFLNLHHQVDLANEVFWGLWLVPFGLLVYRSRFLPRFLGVWLILGCFGYLALSVTGYVFPEYEGKVFTFAQPLMLGELAIMLWLAIVGAKEPRAAAT